MKRITNIENISSGEFKRLLNESNFMNCHELYQYIKDNDGDLTEILGNEKEKNESIFQKYYNTYLDNGSKMSISLTLGDKRLGKFSKDTDIKMRIVVNSNYKQGGFRVKYVPEPFDSGILVSGSHDIRPNILFPTEDIKDECKHMGKDETISAYMDRIYAIANEYIDLFSDITEKESIESILKVSHKYFMNPMVADRYYNLACCQYTYINKALSRIGKKIGVEEIIILASKFVNEGEDIGIYKDIGKKTDDELGEFYNSCIGQIACIKEKRKKEEEIALKYNELVESALKEIDDFVENTAMRYGLEKDSLKIRNFFTPLSVVPEYFSERYMNEKQMK